METIKIFVKNANNKVVNCTAIGYPEPNISLYFNNTVRNFLWIYFTKLKEILSFLQDISSFGISTTSSLIVDLVRLQSFNELTGEYTCRAENIFGIEQKHFFVQFVEGLDIYFSYVSELHYYALIAAWVLKKALEAISKFPLQP